MKPSSIYQLETPMQTVMQASYQMNVNTSFLTNIYTYIMKKLTNVSPFLLLLVPVFIMMVFTITSSFTTSNQDEMAMKTTAANDIVKIVSQK
jgi:hypothetical protein